MAIEEHRSLQARLDCQDKEDETLAEYKKPGAEDILLHYTNLHHHLCSGEAIHCPVESGVAVLVFPCMVNESWRTGRMMAWEAEKKETVSADTVPLNSFPGEMPKPSCSQLTKSDRC